MYDSIKRRRHDEDSDEDDSEEDGDGEEEEEDEEEEEEEEEEGHSVYNLRKEKRQTNRYEPPAPCECNFFLNFVKTFSSMYLRLVIKTWYCILLCAFLSFPSGSARRPRRREVVFQMTSPMHQSRNRIPQHASSPRKRSRRGRTSSTSSSGLYSLCFCFCLKLIHLDL